MTPPRKDIQIAVRFSPELVEAIDREVDRLRSERPGSRVERSDAIREILYQVLVSEPSYAAASAERRVSWSRRAKR